MNKIDLSNQTWIVWVLMIIFILAICFLSYLRDLFSGILIME